jgi:putative spermidine/putrescine transport system substrate-binding protein
MKPRTTKLLAGAVGLSLGLAACGSSTKSSSGNSATTAGSSGPPATTAAPTGSTGNPATATSLASFGGMAGLVAAAKKEGQLNVITLPSNWANYGNIMKDFTAKYGIKITDANPEGSSQNELDAVKQLKGQSRAPDVLDVGTSFALTAAADGLLAPYKVATWNDIPANSKDANGDWYADYGGVIAIGYNSAKVKVAPTSFASLLKPIYKNQVAIAGNPTQASGAFSAVYAAALANGGSFANIAPGVSYFKKLKQVGNFVPVAANGPALIQSGQVEIDIWWDYLQESEIAAVVPTWKVVVPHDATFADYYDQAISATAPDPAAARLWEEYLYSVTGQNLWLQGPARPIELSTLVADGTVDKAALAKLPSLTGTLTFPSNAQNTAAENVVSQTWSSVLGG